MSVILFEDFEVSDLYPITIGKPAFTIRCGTYCLLDQLAKLDDAIAAIVRPHLQATLAEDFTQLTPLAELPPGHTLLVNARLVPSVAARRQLEGLLDEQRTGVVREGNRVAVALLGPEIKPPAEDDVGLVLRYLDDLTIEPLEADLPLFGFPHDVIRHHLTTMSDNLEQRLAEGYYQEIAEGVFAAADMTLAEHVVCDTRDGPIVLEADASIGPHCCLAGPLHVGIGARIIEHASIKHCVALGHTTKVGGEVEASIVEPYTNKQHYGFLGHSYLGSWINMGAGTSNSDLKNTYGEVNMTYRDKKVATGMQFVGAIVGDYAKTAINTGIFTGKTIGVASMVYGYVTTNVPSFVNYARLFGQVTAMPVDVMIATQARMFARRNVIQRPCDKQLLRDMYELTRQERELGSVPLEPLSL